MKFLNLNLLEINKFKYMTSFQYFSDVHTEFYKDISIEFNKFNIVPIAPYLVLSGDIGNPLSNNYRQFLSRLSPMFKKIFLISGNHEYYTQNNYNDRWLEYIDDIIIEYCMNFENIIFLQNETYDIDKTNLTVFGGTFWSKINPNENVRDVISDYSLIPTFTPSKSTQLHDSAVESLKTSLKGKPNRDFVVISHHLPSYKLINEKYKNWNFNSAFASNIDIANSLQIKAWFYGHTHLQNEYGKFHANPIGYPGERIDKNFNEKIII